MRTKKEIALELGYPTDCIRWTTVMWECLYEIQEQEKQDEIS